VVNNSWAGFGGNYWYGTVVGAWRAAGIFPVFAADNEGSDCDTMGSPADYAVSYAAGAIDSNFNIAHFSSRGPTLVTGLQQPDVTAPGVLVRSSVPGDNYSDFSGTSMSAPHVAGAVALAWSAQPELIGQIPNTAGLLSQSATPLFTSERCGGDTATTLPNNTFGSGLLNVEATVANAGELFAPWLEVSASNLIVPPGGSATLRLVFTAPAALGASYRGSLVLSAYEPYNPQVVIRLVVQAGFDGYMPVIVKQE